jgi:organic hydroperoxide reductase OsmC/OhrA
MASIFSTEATAIGGRNGWAASCDGALRLKLSGPHGGGVSPEALLAAACATSFIDTLKRLASELGRTLAEDANVTARVRAVVEQGEPAPPLAVTLFVDLADISGDAAEALAMAAKAECPYARAFDLAQSLSIQVS